MTPDRSQIRDGHPIVTRVLAGCMLAALFAGCGGREGSAGVLGDSAYVEVMSELASLRWRFPTRDSLAADSARFQILRERGLTPEELERFAARRASDPEAMAALWQIIAARADELAGAANRGTDDPQAADSMGARPR